jgi:hypothetical protein
MTEAEELVTYVFKWHTSRFEPEKTCKKCRSLDGKEWHGQDLFETAIFDEIYHKVWSLDGNYSLLHKNCRCQLEITVEFHLEKIEVYNVTVGKPVPLAKTARFSMLSADISTLRNQLTGFFDDLRAGLPTVTDYNEALTMYVALSRKAGLPPLVMEHIRLFEQIRLSAQLATRSIYTLLTAAGPVGWAIGLAGVGLTTLTVIDMASIRRPRY